MTRPQCILGSLIATLALAALPGCFSPGCHSENRTSSVTVDPPQSCLEVGLDRDQNGVRKCDNAYTMTVANHCSETFWVLMGGALPDGGAPDAGFVAGDGGDPFGQGSDSPSIAAGASSSFKIDPPAQPDGSVEENLPAFLGNQPVQLHLSIGATE